MATRATRSKSSSGEDRTTEYALAVTSGKVVAGPDIRNACARHLRDLEHGPARGLKWDLAAAQKAIRFFPAVLRLNGGEHEAVPFELLDWQAFIVGSLFGWKKGAKGYRRFRSAYVESGKGSGKSPLAAGIGLYMLVADNEPRAEVYAAATKKDQAMILFRDAVAMVDMSPELQKRIEKSGTGQRTWNLAYVAKGAFFRAISSDNAQSGPRVHCALIDEVHEHRDGSVVEKQRAGTKGRRQALIFMITNSGTSRTSVCFSYHEYGRRLCAGELENDAFFAFICSLDEGDDPFKDETCWAKANPSLGHTFGVEYLREQVQEARGLPSKEATVRQLNFCQWVDAANPWIDGSLWRACEHDMEMAEFAGRTAYGGLDLSSKKDLTALALVFRRDDGGLDAFVDLWTPADTLPERERQDQAPYSTWVKKGHLHAVPGKVIDYAWVIERTKKLHDDFSIDIESVAFDSYRIDHFQKALGDDGAKLALVKHPQGYYKAQGSELWMPESIEQLEKMVMEGKLRVRLNPCLSWNSASAVLVPDPKNNRIFDKRKSTGRIDGMLALAMAVGHAMSKGDSGKKKVITQGFVRF